MTRTLAVLTVFGLLACLPATASAQDGTKKKQGKREALLKKFDKNGDGKLSREEKAAAREFRDSKRKDGDRKPGLRTKVLKRFDKDGDRKLDDGEREALKKFLHSHREGKRSKHGRR